MDNKNNMSRLTKEQTEFLKQQDIPEELVFDASGLTKTEYHSIMKEQGKIIAFNVTPCNTGGHSLRTRSGHCIQCDTSKIAFIKRAISIGIVYIAGSIKGEVIKIGYTQNKTVRENSLNRTKYGGYDDWIVLFSTQSFNAAEIEHLCQTSLRRYGVSNKYEHDNHTQETYELFSCSYLKAKSGLNEILSNNSIRTMLTKENILKISQYSFRNLIRKI